MEWLSKFKTPMMVNFISMVCMQGVNYLLPLITFPYLFRVLGVGQYGLVTFGYVLIQYFVLFTDFGFNMSATKYIAEHKTDMHVVNRYLNSAMVGRMLLGVISFFLLVLVITLVRDFRQDTGLYLLYFGVVIGNAMYPRWFFQGMEQMKYIAIFTLITKSLSMFPLFFTVREPSHYTYVPICYSIGFILSGFVSLYFIYHIFKMKWFIPSYKEIYFALKDSSTYFLSKASASVYANSGVFFLKLVCGNVMVGYYDAAAKLYQAYNQLIIPFVDVLFPHMVKTRDIQFYKKMLIRIVIANVLLLGLIMLLSDALIHFIYAPDNDYVLQLFRLLIMATFFSIPSMMIGYPLIAAMGHPLYANWMSIITSIANVSVLVILYFCGSVSIYSVCFVVIGSECFLLSLRIAGIHKYKLFAG